MSTLGYNLRAGKTGRPLGMVDVLSKVLETAALGLRRRVDTLQQARSDRARSAAKREAQRSAADLRRLADRERDTAPGFAADLYAAADRHELAHEA